MLRLLLPVLVTFLSALYLAQTVSLSDLLSALRKFDLALLALFCCLSFLGSLIRSLRFLLLLSISGERAPLLPLFCIVLVRNFCSDFLPARLGTAVFIPLARSSLGVSWKAATSSFATAFLLDIAIMGAILSFSVLMLNGKYFGDSFIPLLAAITLTLTASAIFLLATNTRVVQIVIKVLNLFGPRFSKLSSFTSELSKDMKKYKQKGILVSLVLLTITLRGFKYGSLLVLLQSQLVAFEQPLAMTELPKALIGMLSSEAAASLPFSGIGGFGLYEGVWAASFSLLGFEPWLSAVTGVAHHLFTQAWGVILAALAFIALTIQRSFSLPGFKLIVPTSSKLAWGLSLCGLLLLSPLPLLITSSHGADSQREAVSEQRIAERPNGLLSGTVLYDSNEKGSFDIFAYNLETQESRTVVSSKMHEQHPVFHPAQAKVLFHRAPSSNRYAPSDIIALDIKDRTETILFKNAHFASLFGDKERIVFGRARKEVFIGNLVNGQEEKIFPNKRFSEFRRAEIVRPVLSQDENFLSFVSSYPRRWTVWRIALDGSSRISIPDSCQPSFSQNTEFSFVSLSAARAGTGIHFFDGTNSKLLDRNDPFGKEYFPFLQDSRWLFFSACSSHEHSHTSANYEVFLQDLQKSALYQLTSNGATNRWPHYSADEFLRKLFE